MMTVTRFRLFNHSLSSRLSNQLKLFDVSKRQYCLNASPSPSSSSSSSSSSFSSSSSSSFWWRRTGDKLIAAVSVAATAVGIGVFWTCTTTKERWNKNSLNCLSSPISLSSSLIAHSEAPSSSSSFPKHTTDIKQSSSVSIPISPLSRYAVADAAEKVLPSVVNIRRMTTVPRTIRSLFGVRVDNGGNGMNSPELMSCGSGFFIDDKGLIMTNAHVVGSSSSTISTSSSSSSLMDYHLDDNNHDSFDEDDEDSILYVTLSNGEVYHGRIVAIDEASDIALIRINSTSPTPAATLGDSDIVRPGEFVVTVGSPLSLSNSVSFGIISTIHRDLFLSHSPSSSSSSSSSSNHHHHHHAINNFHPMSLNQPIVPSGLTYLQLDVAINQGSSGGPCVNLDGRVIGMCSMKIAGDAEGIAFAIPISYAKRVVSDLQTYGYVRRPYVGLTLISVTPRLFEDIRQDSNYRPPRWLESEMRKTNSAKSVGLMVHHLSKDGPGEKAGLKPGDVVISVNGQSTKTTSEFLAALASNVQKDCSVTVRRASTGRTDQLTIRPEVLNVPSRMRRWA